MSGAERLWYADGLRFGCTNCGACCKLPGYVYVTQEEAERMARLLALDLQAFGRRYLRRTGDGRTSLTETQDYACIMWADETGCRVYRARPGQCRRFPFWPENLKAEKAWQEWAEVCPGMDRGRHYPLDVIDRILDERRGTRSGPRRRKLHPRSGR